MREEWGVNEMRGERGLDECGRREGGGCLRRYGGGCLRR